MTTEEINDLISNLDANELYDLIIALKNQCPHLIGNFIGWLTEKQ